MRFHAPLAASIALIPLLCQGQGQKIDYARDIQPILSDKCYQCHGPDQKARKAKLRLDLREDAIKNRDGFHAILPGKPDESNLIDRIQETDPDEIMPPPKTGKKLSVQEIALIKQWISEGADFTRHWAFVPPRKPPTPKTLDTVWSRSSLDKFVLAKLEREGLKPSPEADRATWLRRASFDLIGLPPTVSELDTFLSDKSPQAYQMAADRILASSSYGEHMARYWLDAVRYGRHPRPLRFGRENESPLTHHRLRPSKRFSPC